MKITKSELKEMIRECLREELNLTEAAISGGQAEGGFLDTAKRPGGSTQPDHKSYLGRLKNKNPDLVDTMVIKGKDIKPGMLTQAGQVKEVEVGKNGKTDKVYIMHTNNYDGFWGTDEDMIVMVDPENKSKPFTGDYKALLKMGLKEEVEEAAEVTEGIFGNKYKGMDILVFRGNGKDEAIAIASVNANNYNLLNFKKAHAKKNNNKESDYQLVAATDVAVKKYKNALKSIPDVTSTLPGWVSQYVKDAEAQHAQDYKKAERQKELEAEAKKAEAKRKAQNSGSKSDDEYIYTKGNGTGTYKYREDLDVDNIFENLY